MRFAIPAMAQAQRCRLCELLGPLSGDSGGEDRIEKVLNEVGGELLRWRDPDPQNPQKGVAVKLNMLSSQSLWEELVKIVHLDWNPETSFVNLCSKSDASEQKVVEAIRYLLISFPAILESDCYFYILDQ